MWPARSYFFSLPTAKHPYHRRDNSYRWRVDCQVGKCVSHAGRPSGNYVGRPLVRTSRGTHPFAFCPLSQVEKWSTIRRQEGWLSSYLPNYEDREPVVVLQIVMASALGPPWEGTLRDQCEFGRSSRSRKISLLLLFLALLFGPPARAQKSQTRTANAPKYDLQTEAKLKGTIEEVKLPPKGSEKEIVHLIVKSGPDAMDVYLCPKSFMDEMGMDFKQGDEITLTGSKVKQGETDLVLAREVVKGNNTFLLRDAKGGPVWN